MSFVIVPKPRRSPLPYQIAAILIGSAILFFMVIGLMIGTYRLIHLGRIFPGVSVGTVDLSRMTVDQASVVLHQRLTFPASGRIVFRGEGRIWVASPAELGLVYDIGKSVQLAYGTGRQGGQLASLAGQLNAGLGGIDLPPVAVLDQRVAYQYLQNLAAQLDQPAGEADLQLQGTTVVYVPGRTGRRLNVDRTMTALVSQLQSFRDGTVDLVLEDQPPLILDASAPANTLRQILSAPLTLTNPDAQAGEAATWTIDTTQLAGMLSVGKVGNGSKWQYQIAVNTQPVQPLLDQIAGQVNHSPQNARFYFDDNTRQLVLIQSALDGQLLDEDATRQAIQEGLLQGTHNIALKVAVAKPQVSDDATAASLGITELVSQHSLYFRGSTSDRVQNIVTASARFHGLLVPPNTTFSMADALGDVSLDNGYAEAPIIFNGRSILGVGGGVCQVSTTLFQTAFYGGYPIVERTQHAYRVRYYEENATGYDPNLVGLDATVFVPLVDLKFKNDRSSWLLMEVYVDTKIDRITWKFYSSEARKVDVAAPVITDIVPPPTDWQFEEDSSLSAGEIVPYQTAADGESVVINRTVYKPDGTMLFADSVQTTYAPRQAVCQYGTGTQNPEALARQAGLCQP